MTARQWPYRPLGELVTVLDHKRIPVSAKERATRPGVVPYYGATGQVGWIDLPLFNEPLLLLGEDGVKFFDRDKKKAYIISGPSWVNNHAHVLRPHEDVVDRRFLLHFLNRADFHGFANGTTRLKLTKSAMERMPVLVPSLAEQRRTVEILEDHLSRLDAADGSISIASARSAALRHSWLAQMLGNPPEEELAAVGERLIEARGGWSRGRRHETGSGQGVPYLKMNNITRDGNLLIEDVVHVDGPEDEVTRFSVHAGDILFNSKNSGDLVGKTALATDGVEGWTFNENIMRLRFDNSVRPDFAWLWFQSPFFRNHIRAAVRASTNVAAIYFHQLRLMPVWVPSLPRQFELVVEFAAVREASERLTAELELIRRQGSVLRRTLLQSAFSGRLDKHAKRDDAAQEAANV